MSLDAVSSRVTLPFVVRDGADQRFKPQFPSILGHHAIGHLTGSSGPHRLLEGKCDVLAVVRVAELGGQLSDCLLLAVPE